MKELGCEYGQGYLFSRPVEADSVLNFLTKEAQRALALGLDPIAAEGEAVVAALYPM